jgi:hypothetical protein
MTALLEIPARKQKLVRRVIFLQEDSMGSAGFEPATSSAQGWHHTKLDNDPSKEYDAAKSTIILVPF